MFVKKTTVVDAGQAVGSGFFFEYLRMGTQNFFAFDRCTGIRNLYQTPALTFDAERCQVMD
jgi:hypothetical protein